MAAKKQRSAVTSKDVLDALRAKYSGGDEREWAGGTFVDECGVNGNGSQSRADALYMGFTSASGRLFLGFEIKVSRSDWLAELKKVGKADFWHDNCHQWYIVAPPGIVGDGELPEGWGLMLLEGHRLTTHRRATTRDVTPSWTAMRSFCSRAETLRAGSVRRAISEADDAARNRIYALQGEIESLKRQTGGYSAGEEQMRRMVAAVRERLGEEHIYTDIEEELVTTAYFDYALIEDATRQLRRQLNTAMHQYGALIEGIRPGYGSLQKIIKQFEDEEKEKADG